MFLVSEIGTGGNFFVGYTLDATRYLVRHYNSIFTYLYGGNGNSVSTSRGKNK